jgi:1-acyl-sn-glycerol-3-phosphate acyltransferase
LFLYGIVRRGAILAYKIWYRVSFEGVENIPDPKDGTFVVACNHRSYADPVLLALKIKRPCCFMAKEELFKNPLFSALIRFFGAFPVRRGAGDDGIIDTAVGKLKTGKNLAIFPEGSRSKDGKVGRGKTGVALIAARAGVPVLPVGIAYEGKLHFGTKVTVRYGKPISPEQLKISETPHPRELKMLKLTIMDAITELVEK